MKAILESEVVELTVVLPSLRESENIKVLLPRLVETLEQLKIGWEILIVDGDSKDGTEEIVNAVEGARYILETEAGYGTAILRGVREARGEYVLTMDSDLSHPAEFVSRLWALREGTDLMIASRYVPGGSADQPWVRLQLSKVLNRFFRSGLSMDICDMSSGFRLYRKRIFDDMDLEFRNFVVLVEILLKAYGKGMRIKEVPFQYRPRKEGQSKSRIIHFGLDYLRLFRKMWALRNSVDFPDYDWRAHNSRIWFQRYWQRKRHDIILRYAPPELKICDVGCGSSHILADLPQAVGVDLRHDKLAYMRRTNKLLVQGDGMGLPFDRETFDCVISSEVIEHIPEENGKHIDELLRVLRPGGILVLGTPDYGGWQWPIIEWIYGKVAPGAYADEHVTHYTFKGLRQALIDRGCEILEHDYICKAELIFKARKLDRDT